MTVAKEHQVWKSEVYFADGRTIDISWPTVPVSLQHRRVKITVETVGR